MRTTRTRIIFGTFFVLMTAVEQKSFAMDDVYSQLINNPRYLPTATLDSPSNLRDERITNGYTLLQNRSSQGDKLAQGVLKNVLGVSLEDKLLAIETYNSFVDVALKLRKVSPNVPGYTAADVLAYIETTRQNLVERFKALKAESVDGTQLSPDLSERLSALLIEIQDVQRILNFGIPQEMFPLLERYVEHGGNAEHYKAILKSISGESHKPAILISHPIPLNPSPTGNGETGSS